MSITALCRSALNLLGDYPLNDLQEDSKQARLCREEFYNARDTTLSAAPWRAPRTRINLASVSPGPLFGWGFKYNLPHDLAYLIPPTVEGDPNGQQIEYEKEGTTLLCDVEGPLPIVYIPKIADTTKYDDLLCRAIEAHLAMRIAFPIGAAPNMRQEMATLYQFYIGEAERVDSKHGTPKKPKATTWETAIN